MEKSIPVMLTPEILRWARNLDMITVEEIVREITDLFEQRGWSVIRI